jgi:hypothetical protein
MEAQIGEDNHLATAIDMDMPFGYPQISISGPAYYGSGQVQGLEDDLETKKKDSNLYSTRTLVKS